MRHLTTTLLALAGALSSLPTTTLAAARKTPADAVLLSKIKTLTLHAGRQTTSRRGPPVPQLECVGGNARGLHSVDVMRCTNAGADYAPEDVQWTCQASLPSEFKLGSTEVVCEGYESPEDPYVLKGSCGVEYRLILTEAGERRFGERTRRPKIGPSTTTRSWSYVTPRPRTRSQIAWRRTGTTFRSLLKSSRSVLMPM